MTLTILLFLLLLATVLLFVIFSELVAFLRTRVPFVPTHAGDVEFIVKKLGISNKDTFYDLGSGNGKVVFLVNQLTGAKCIGYELSWWTYLYARLKNWLAFPDKAKRINDNVEWVQFRNENFFKANWSEANYIYAYLYPPLMGRIEEKFQAEMKPGSVAVVRDFPFPNMPYTEKHFLPKKHEIYIYKK